MSEQLSAEQIEKSQAEFIEWAQKKHSITVSFLWGELVLPPRQGHQVPVIMHAAWDVWITRQQTLCVELPSAKDYASASCSIKEIVAFNMAVSIVESKLEAAGVRVKS